MFTWKPIYKELATVLLDFENRQDELISILTQMREQGIKTISLSDQNPNGNAIPLKVMDPFTFFANFNRWIKDEERQQFLSFIKKSMSLSANAPNDFSGIPTVDNRQAWFFPYAFDRKDSDINNLWELAKSVVVGGPETIDLILFKSCLNISKVGIRKLTIGMFWLNPEQYISVDWKNMSYFESVGIKKRIQDLQNYNELIVDVREKIKDDFATISHSAHLRATGKIVDIEKTNDLLQAYFERVAKVKQIPFGKVAEFFVNHEWNEFFGRKESFEAIRDTLNKMPVDIDALREVFKNKGYIAGGAPPLYAQMKNFFEHPGANSVLSNLLGDKTDPPNASSINEFLEIATDYGFHNKSRKPVLHNAALFTSVILSAVFPETFVDFRANRWDWASEVFALEEGSSARDYGEWLWWAGRAANQITQTSIFKENFENIDIELMWSASALVYFSFQNKEFRSIAEDSNGEPTLKYWIFQGNPQIFDVDTYIRQYSEINWMVSRYADEIDIGDKAIIWRSGSKNGIIALAEITSKPTIQPDKSGEGDLWTKEEYSQIERKRCDLRVTERILPNFLSRDKIKNVLPNLSIIKSPQGTNFKIKENEYREIKRMVEDLGRRPEKEMFPLNLILYGPPGTGKTYQTIYKSVEIIDGKKPLGEFSKVKERYDELLEKGQIGFVTFHQSYSYEDFVEGIRPVLSDDSSEAARYDCRPGLFRIMCEQAASIEKRTALYDFDPSVIKFYKMSLGDTLSGDEDIYEYCIENNVISLGWGRDVDFSDCSSKLDIREKYNDKYPDESPFGVDAMLRFKNWMKRNDIVIVSRGNHQIRAIGKVTSDYTFNLETPIRHNQFRDVEWLYKDAIIPVNQILKEKVLSQQTIYQFYDKDLNIEGIKSLLSTSVGEEEKRYVLIIDEINRGNISKILGELITLLEPDKRIGAERELIVKLPYSQKQFGIPSNLYIIGTMNTADKSIALVDVALRRRFLFEELMPDFSICKNLSEDMLKVLHELNNRITLRKDRDHQIGHSYFIEVENTNSFNKVFKDSIIPLLQEYFWNDWEGLQFVLGEEEKKRGKFIVNIPNNEMRAARNKWQWYSDAGITAFDFLDQLRKNYKKSEDVPDE